MFFSEFFQLDIGQAVARELWASQADLEALTGAPAKKPKESIRYVVYCFVLFCGFSLHFACNLLFPRTETQEWFKI